MTYRPEIDGLRAIAVVPVILFHAGFTLFGGGYAGVDIFFVISGYLITSILMKELDEGKFSVGRFYERRIRRLLPALFVVLLASAIVGWQILMPSDFQDFAESVVATILCGSNFLFWQESSYWDTASELKPLLHTWSLAVEEQYYIIFPPFLYLFYRWSKKSTFGLIILGAILSLIGAEVLSHYRPTANFFLLPFRAWEMLIGSIAAFVLSYEGITSRIQASRGGQEVFSWAGLLMILGSIFFYDSFTRNPSVWMLLPTMGTFLIILYCNAGTTVARILSLKPMVMIGLISYSAYLWHQPIFAYTRYVAFPEQSKWLFGALSIGVFPLAYLSWKYIENPFRNKSWISRRAAFTSAAIYSIFFLVFGGLGMATNGFSSRGQYQNLLIKAYQPDNKILQQNTWTKLRTLSGSEDYKVAGNSYDLEPWYSSEDTRQKLLIVGNSHCKDMYNVLTLSKDTSDRYQIARFGVEIRNALKEDTGLLTSPNYNQADVIMICSRYNREDADYLKKVTKRFLADGKVVAITRNIYEFEGYGNTTFADKIFQRYADRINSGEVSANKLVHIINEEHYKQTIRRQLNPSVLKSQAIIDQIEKDLDVVVLNRDDYAKDEDAQVYHIIDTQFQKFTYDGAHHSLAGASFYAQRVDQIGWLSPLNTK